MTTVLFSQRLTLRLLEPRDAESIERLASDPDVADTTLNIPHPYPAGSAATFIQRRQEAAARGDGYSFAITLTESGTVLGVVGLNPVMGHDMAEMGYWLGKPYWGNGYCSEAAARIVQYAFEELQLNRVFAAAMTRNPASYRVMEKIGMKYEGTLRHHIRKGDAYEDLQHYGILRSDER